MDSHLHIVSPEPSDKDSRAVVTHYYGDIVRRLFLIAGVVILVSLPFVWDLSPLAALLSSVVVMILVLEAGVTTPKKEWTAYVNAVISGVGLVIYELFAVYNYSHYQASVSNVALFLLSQIIATIFLFALYFASKTMRAMVLHEQLTKEEVYKEFRDPL